jgi:hypothetical protein
MAQHPAIHHNLRALRRGRIGAAIALACVLATALPSAGPRRADLPVKTILSDADAAGTPFTLQSDSAGPYLNGVDSVISVLMANVYNNLYNGDWEMDASASALRRVEIALTPANAAAVGSPGYTVSPKPPFWGIGIEAARIIDKCTEFGKSVLTLRPGQTISCPLLVRWDSRSTYRLDMGAPVEAPESTPAQITCNVADESGCRDWFLDPLPSTAADGTPIPGAIARLVSVANNGSTTNLGDFYMTFHFHVTR